MKGCRQPRVYKQIVILITALAMMFTNTAGYLAAANVVYPDFKVNVTSEKSGGGEINLGSTINIKIEFDKLMDGQRRDPFTYSLYINEKYVSSPSAAFISQTIEDPSHSGNKIPIFAVSQSAIAGEVIGYTGNYYRYDFTYNTAAHEIDSNIVKANMETHIQISEDKAIIDIEEPILIETSTEFIIHKPDIVDVPVEFEIQKDVTKQYRYNLIKDLYEPISTDGFKGIQIGDVYEFRLAVKNISKIPVNILPGDVKDCLPASYDIVNIKEFVLEAAAGSTMGKNNWVIADIQDMDGYVIYDCVESYNGLSAGSTAYFYFYAKARTRDPQELQNVFKMGDKTAAAGPPSVGPGSPRRDLAAASYFAEVYPGGMDLNGNPIENLEDANQAVDTGNVPVKYTFSPNVSSFVPYVMEGDILRLRTYIYNQSSVIVNNIVMAYYGLFDGTNQVFEIVDEQYSLNDVPNTYEVSPNCEWENPNLSIKTMQVPKRIASYSDDFIDILVRVKKYPSEKPYDRYIYTEVAGFEFEEDTEVNNRMQDNHYEQRGSFAVDIDSVNDCNPYNDMTYNGKFKEKDNVITENALNNSLKDEDDFDYAYIRSISDYELPAKVELQKDINKSVGESIFNLSKSQGKYSYKNNYKHLPADNIITQPYTYIAYRIMVNYGGIRDLQQVELKDVLPKGLTFLTDDKGRFVYDVRFMEGIGPYAGDYFPANDSNYYKTTNYYSWGTNLTSETGITVDCDKSTNTLTLNAQRLEHKMMEFYLLAVVDSANIDYNVSYSNSASLKATGLTLMSETSPSITWQASSAAAYIKKYMKVDGSWVETGSSVVNELPADAGEFRVDYRISVINLSTGGGFAKNGIAVTDQLGVGAKSVSNIKMSGISGGKELTNEQLADVFTAKAVNNTVEIKNDIGALPTATAEYYFDFTVTYYPINHGESVVNQLFGKAVYSVKPLELSFLKTDMDGRHLRGSVFHLLYEDGTSVRDRNGKQIEIKPGTDKNKAIFVPKNYPNNSQWNLLLKEVTPPTGYKARDYRLIVTKDNNGVLTVVMYEGDEDYMFIEDGMAVTLKNEKIPSIGNPSGPSDPDDRGPAEVPDIEKTPDEGTNPDIPKQPEDTKEPSDSGDNSEEELIIPDYPFPLGPMMPTEVTRPEDILEVFDDDRTPLGGLETGSDTAIGIDDMPFPLGSMDGGGMDEFDDVPRTGDDMRLFGTTLLFFLSVCTLAFGILMLKKDGSAIKR